MLQVSGFRCRFNLPGPEGWDVLGEGVPRVGHSHGQQLPGSFPFLSSEKDLQDSSGGCEEQQVLGLVELPVSFCLV